MFGRTPFRQDPMEAYADREEQEKMELMSAEERKLYKK